MSYKESSSDSDAEEYDRTLISCTTEKVPEVSESVPSLKLIRKDDRKANISKLKYEELLTKREEDQEVLKLQKERI